MRHCLVRSFAREITSRERTGLALQHLRDDASERPRGRRWWLWVLIPILLVGAAELAVRFAEPKQAQDSQAAGVIRSDGGLLSLQPESSFAAGKDTISINKLGLRGELPDESRIKIAVLGGDAVFNGRIGDRERDSTLTGLLESGLSMNRVSNRFQFINAGVPGLTVSDAKGIVERALLPAGTDLVVLMVGEADLAAIARAGGSVPSVGTEAPAPGGLGEYSALWRLVVGEGESVSHGPVADVTALHTGTRAFSAGLRRFVAACRAAKMGVILATEPGILFSESPGLVQLRNEAAHAIGLDVVSLSSTRERVRSLLQAVADGDRGVHYIDLAREVAMDAAEGDAPARPTAKEPSFYASRDPVLLGGLTSAGIARAARALEKFLIRSKAWGARRQNISLVPSRE